MFSIFFALRDVFFLRRESAGPGRFSHNGAPLPLLLIRSGGLVRSRGGSNRLAAPID